MNIVNTRINLGLKHPQKVLHISDTHLTFADKRDCERKIKLAENRKGVFPGNNEFLAEVQDYARSNHLLIVHTGDIIDFVSEANIEKAKEFTDSNDVFMVAGNHEFSLYLGEAVEDEAYRNQSLDKVQKAFKNDIRFAVKEFPEFKLIGIDDSYYRFDEEQYRKLLENMNENKPIVLLLHTPIYEKNLYDTAIAESPSADLVGVPDELMKSYPEKAYVQQKADAITLKTLDLIKNSPVIKAVLCGHLHYDFSGFITPSLPQYMTGTSTARVVEFF